MKKPISKRTRLLLLTSALLACSPDAWSQVALLPGGFSGGSGQVGNAQYRLRGSVSQTGVGTGSNETYAVGSGFWYRVGDRVVIGLEEAGAGPGDVPDHYVLDQNYPNPFNPSTTIPYGLPETARVRVEVFDVLGRLVRVLVDRELPAGFHTVSWNARGSGGQEVPSGLYLVRMTAPKLTITRKMMLVR